MTAERFFLREDGRVLDKGRGREHDGGGKERKGCLSFEHCRTNRAKGISAVGEPEGRMDGMLCRPGFLPGSRVRLVTKCEVDRLLSPWCTDAMQREVWTQTNATDLADPRDAQPKERDG